MKDPSEHLPKGKAPGSGEISREQTSVHVHQYGSLWFRTEEGVERYRWVQNTRRAAVRAGWPHTTQRELEKFDKHRTRYRDLVQRKRKREAEAKARRAKLRKELDLNPADNLAAKALAPGGERYIRMMELEAADADKLDIIRQMIEDRTPIQDFMIRVSNIVGAKL